MENETQMRLTYDWNAPIMSGTVVCSKFNTFNGEERTGLFCILYDEQIDGNVLNKKNVLAIKLTTQDSTIGDYTVAVNQLKNPFLDQKCAACCSKVHVLHKKQQIYKVIGMLDKQTYNRIVKTFVNFQSKVTKQLLDRI